MTAPQKSPPIPSGVQVKPVQQSASRVQVPGEPTHPASGAALPPSESGAGPQRKPVSAC